MNETQTTDNKKDGGIKVTLSLDNEMLAQMISKGDPGSSEGGHSHTVV